MSDGSKVSVLILVITLCAFYLFKVIMSYKSFESYRKETAELLLRLKGAVQKTLSKLPETKREKRFEKRWKPVINKLAYIKSDLRWGEANGETEIGFSCLGIAIVIMVVCIELWIVN